MKAMFRLPSSLFCVFFLCLSLSLVHHTYSSFIPTNASSSVHHSCSEDEHAALLALKHSFTLSDPHYPDEFINKTRSWKKGTDCCAWEGIRCHPVTHHVIVLDLSNNGLGEVIHSNSSLFKLHHLRSLNLSINWFSSRISSNFGQFQFLKHLDLSGNKFSVIRRKKKLIKEVYNVHSISSSEGIPTFPVTRTLRRSTTKS